ncbi:MAG: AAA family ATPase [Bacteroidales bacterium]|nr:AAA family ATPase [Bacteroidales bacterium]MCF8456257.1 AAA family ATPase [Bacteroidales bacterium]
MLKKHIKSVLTDKLGFYPTSTQEQAISVLGNFIQFHDKYQVFLLKGFAGTGKTTMIKALVDTLAEFKLNSVLMAPTGRAAKVMSAYTGQPASTIHRKIYRQQSSKDGFGKFSLNFNPHADTFFMVDEASMISNSSADSSVFGSGRLLDDVYTYVFKGKNCKLILIGDEAQLPPVGLVLSPALDLSELQAFGFETAESSLTEVVRQALDSGILKNSFIVRRMIEENNIAFPRFELENFDDIVRLSGEDLIDTISGSYDSVGMEETMIVCRSNKRANNFNLGIRNKILWREEELTSGDYLMVVKNNYFWLKQDEKNLNFIANGDSCELTRIFNYEERYGHRFANVRLKLHEHNEDEIEAKIFMDTLTIDGPSLPAGANKELFFAVLEDYADESTKAKRYQKVREDPYFNALQVKFAYAVTCHKAQGGQWKHVFLDQGYVTEDMLSIDYLRWLYTGITRASEKLYLVNFGKQFFDDKEEEF